MKLNKTLILKIILAIVYVSLLVFFSVQCLKDGTSSEVDSSFIGNLNADIIEALSGITIVRDSAYYNLIRKLYGHYGFFVVLGTSSWLFYYFDFEKLSYAKKMFLHFTTGFIFALISEFVFQSITTGRGPSFTDCLIDYGGFITVSLIITIIVYFEKIKLRK